jgi:replicative DNA helicase
MPRDGQHMAELPANIEAEQALLGAILVKNSCYHQVSDLLRPEHFAQGVHGRIYAAMAQLIDSGKIANPVTLKDLFNQDESLAEIDGFGYGYLTKLAASVVTIINAADYGRQIADAAQRRAIILACRDTEARAFEFSLDGNAAELLREHEQAIHDITDGGRDRAMLSASIVLDAHAKRVESAYKAGGRVTGLETGLADLDRLIGGLKPGRLHILAGRPGMGKSLSAGVFALNAGRKGKRIAIFTLEATRELWAARWISRLTGIPTDQQDRGDLNDNEWSRFLSARDDIRSIPVMIDETPSVTAQYIRHKARHIQRQGGLDLIIVDHAQKMRQAGKQENRRLEIGDISNALASLSKETGAPLLLLSQLSRAVESRDDKRPTLSDLRESGDLEQDADVVIFCYRHAYYLERAAPERKPGEHETAFMGRQADHETSLNDCRNLAEFIVAKNRGGPVGTVKAYFDGAKSIVADLHRGGPL